MACEKNGLCKDGNWQCILYKIRNALKFFSFLCCNTSPCFRKMAQKISSTKGKVLFMRQEKRSFSEVQDCCTTHTATIYLGHFSCWWENGTYLWKLALKQNILKWYCNDQANGTTELKFQWKFPLVKIGNTYERHNVNEHLPSASKK